MQRGGGGGGWSIAVWEERAWTPDLIWAENYTLIYIFFQANWKFQSFSRVAHGWLPRCTCLSWPQQCCEQSGSWAKRGIAPFQLTEDTDAGWFRHKDKARWSSCLGVTSWEKEKRSPSCLPAAEPVVWLRNSLMQTLITLILTQSKLPTLGFVTVAFLSRHPAECDYI